MKRPKVRYLREVWMKTIDGKRIASARQRAGYSQRELALLSKCTQAAISGLETGAMRGCSENLADAICKWLDRDVDDLFERHEGSRVQRVTNAAGSKRQTVAA